MAPRHRRDRFVLAQRILSAAIGVPIILLLIFVGGIWYVAAVAAALAVASFEFQHARRDWLDPVCVLIAVLVAGIAVGAHVGRYEWLAWIAAALVLPLIAVAFSPTEDGAAADAVWALGGIAWIGLLGSFFVLLRDVTFDGRSWIYLAVLSTFAVDTAAYFVGRRLGKHPLAPRISPKKTIEGFAGGWIAGVIAVIAVHSAFDLGIEPWRVSLLAALLPIAAAAGDLTESAIKRAMDIKDASSLIPGHGGVLDRLDSLLFVCALVYAFAL